MPFTDPMADGPAIQAAGLRALAAGQNMKKTLAAVREFRAGDDATPIVLMGYYNPIYVYGVERFLADAKSGRRRRADRRRSAARGGRRIVPAGAAGRPQFHPPRHADDRRQAAAGRAHQHVGLCLLRLDHRHHRRRRARRRQGRRSGRAHQAPHQAAGLRRLRRAHRRAGARDRRTAPTASWSARRWSRRCARVSAPDGKPTPATVAAVTDLVRALAEGVRGAPARVAANGARSASGRRSAADGR